MDELQLYGTDGLFHNVVRKSKVFAGRYAVLAKGADLNANNVLSGIELPVSQFPGVFCLPPLSTMESTTKNSIWECFYFRLFFLCTTNYTGDNQFKFRDKNTNTSQHPVNYDWSDMKMLALNFMHALEVVQMKIIREFRLGQTEKWKIMRISNAQNQNLSGVMLQFDAHLSTPCEFTDIRVNDIII